MKSTVLNLFLLLAGSIGIIIGTCLLFTPISFEASAGIYISNDASVLSEIRSSGGMLIGAGFLIALGAFSKNLTKVSLIISTLFYLSYGISRLIGMMLDGLPSDSLIQVTIAELVMASISIILLQRFLKHEALSIK